MAGRELAVAEINEFWEAWAPSEVAQRMSTVAAPWYVAAGWALELFTGDAARGHDDLEIAVPAVRFGEVMAAFPGFDWYVVGDGQQRLLPRSDDIAVVAADAVGIGVGAIWTFSQPPAPGQRLRRCVAGDRHRRHSCGPWKRCRQRAAGRVICALDR